MTRLLLRTALTGHSVAEVEVELDDTVASLRSLVQAQASRSLVRFNLLVGGKVLKDHELLRHCLDSQGVVEVVYLSKCMATAIGNSVRIWDLTSGDCREFSAQGQVRKVAVLPDQKHVFTGSDDGTARLWRLEGGECLQRLEHAAPVSDLSCSPTGGLLLTLSNGRLSVWEASTGQRLWHLDHGYVLQAFFLPGSEESEFLSVSDETVRIWSLQRADPITLEGHSAVILSIVCSKNGERICSGSLDKTVRVWDRQGSCLWVLHGHYDAVRAVAISERWLASSSGVAARVWSMESGSCDAIINDHAGSIISMQFSRDSGLLLVAFGCGREVFNNFTSSGVKVWCTSTKQCVAFHSTGSFILGAHLLDGPSILIATAERVELWQSEHRTLDLRFEGRLRAIGL
ncbi:Vegetative incompatibility protein HET-E-1 [Durusdinium trenchii]|uniref:Vegetative incompatibility protein HET-E-1 n=1 Tax=Durusdinium trenchii TaxID=1381693 RepID=A0ABP0LH29_9DINO